MLLDARSYPIQRVLEQYLEPKNLAYAMRLWSTHYITQPNISLQRFVDDFYSRQPIIVSSYGLYSDLLPAMMSALQARSQFTGEPIDGYEFPDYDLGGPSTMSYSSASQSIQTAAPINAQPPPPIAKPEPVVPVEDAQIAATPETPPTVEPPARPKDEKFVIFSSFIRQLLNGVSPERREKMLYRNRIELKGTCKPEAAEPLYSWLQTDSDYFQHNAIGIDEMTAITHIVYMGLCEYQGPVDADRILMKVAGNINDAYPFASLDINQLL